MRLILYSLIAVGGVLFALALTMVFKNDDVVKTKLQGRHIERASAPIKQLEMRADAKALTLQPEVSAPAGLTIDIARIKPDGAAVFAGTASPNAIIRIFEEKVILGKTVADLAGEWVIVLERSLAAGQHLILIAMESDDGSMEIATRSLAVEVYKNASAKPLVALLPETATEVPVLIQSPDDSAPATSKTSVMDTKNTIAGQQKEAVKAAVSSSNDFVGEGALSGRAGTKSSLAVIFPTAITWRDASRILISGSSKGGVRIIVTDADGLFGEALVLTDGAWQIGGTLALKTVQHSLKFSLLDDIDNVVARYNLPVKSRDLAKGKDGSLLIVVNKGDALWRIAYRRFGDGYRYVDIVRRNQKNIANPDLSYPKQIFVLPKSEVNAKYETKQ